MVKWKKGIRISVWNKYNKRCAYCGIKLQYDKMQIDHITPIHRGTLQSQLNVLKGKNTIENYNPSCKSCNSSKSTYTVENWRYEISQKKDRLLRDSSTFRLLNRFKLITTRDKKVLFYFEKHKQ